MTNKEMAIYIKERLINNDHKKKAILIIKSLTSYTEIENPIVKEKLIECYNFIKKQEKTGAIKIDPLKFILHYQAKIGNIPATFSKI